MSATSSTVSFKQKDKTKRDKNIKKSILSFDAEEQQEEPEEQQQQHSHTQLQRPAAISFHAEEVKEEEDDYHHHHRDRRHRQHHQHQQHNIPTTNVGMSHREEDREIRTGIGSIHVGDDYESASESLSSSSLLSSKAEPVTLSSSMYTKEALQALRSNAIHTHTATKRTEEEELAADNSLVDDSNDGIVDAQAAKVIREAKMQRARMREAHRLGDDFIPISNITNSTRKISTPTYSLHKVSDEEDDGDDVIQLSSKSGPMLSDADSTAAAAANNDIKKKGRVARAYGLTSEHTTSVLIREDESDDIIDMTNDADTPFNTSAAEAERLLVTGKISREEREAAKRQEIRQSLTQQARKSKPKHHQHLQADHDDNDEQQQEEQGHEMEGDDVLTISSDDSDENEMEEWEIEQLKKSGVKLKNTRNIQQAQLLHSDDRTQRRSARTRNNNNMDNKYASIHAAASAAHTSLPCLSSLNYDKLHTALTQQLADLTHTHTLASTQLTQLQQRITTLQQQQVQYTKQAEDLNEQYIFYQDIRDHMMAVLACLSEKVLDIDEAWRECLAMKEKRGLDREERMSSYRLDEWETLSGENKMRQAEEDEVHEVDEFGRDIEYVREVGKDRREQIRSRVREMITQERQRRKEKISSMSESLLSPVQMQSIELEGWITDDEYYESAEGYLDTYQDSFASFTADVESIFEDVSEEYNNITAVTGQLHHWKQRYPTAYHDAYISLSLPKLVAPFVRVEVMKTHILPPYAYSPTATAAELYYSTPLSFSSAFVWYKTLQQYGRIENNTTMAEEDDEDRQLIPILCTNILAPYLLHCVRFEWQVLSEQHTRKLLDCLQQCKQQLAKAGERGIKSMQDLIDAIIQRLTQKQAEPWHKATEGVLLSASSVSVRQTLLLSHCHHRLKLLYLLLLWCSVLDAEQPLQPLLCQQLSAICALWSYLPSLSSHPTFRTSYEVWSSLLSLPVVSSHPALNAAQHCLLKLSSLLHRILRDRADATRADELRELSKLFGEMSYR